MSNSSCDLLDVSACLRKSVQSYSVENEEGHWRFVLKRSREAAQLYAVKSAAYLAVGILANILVAMPL